MENFDLENLGKVWERVSPPDSTGAPESAPDTAGWLRNFIDGEAADAAMYTLLALKTKGSSAERVLRRIAADERHHEKRLQTEYFMLTGDTWMPRTRQPSAPYLLAALRERYIEEQKGAENYESAAKKTEEPRLRAMLFELARDERRHALAIRSLVDKFMN
ncbi:MAG: ferritin family protein [Oscillospiraceae bacterium]